MRLNARINDETDLVNKQFVDALLSKLDDTTIADLKKAIDELEDSRKWESFGNSYTADSFAKISSILLDAAFEQDPVDITCKCAIDSPLALSVDVRLYGSNKGVDQNYKQNIIIVKDNLLLQSYSAVDGAELVILNDIGTKLICNNSISLKGSESGIPQGFKQEVK